MYKRRYLFLASLLLLFFSISVAIAEKAPDTTAYHFLALSDIHFDPFLSCVHKIPCPLIQKLRLVPAAKWEKILAEADHTKPDYRYDTNYPLLTAVFTFTKTLSVKHPIKFALVLGDSLGHDYRRYYKKYSADKSSQGYQSFVRKTLEFLTAELAAAFPNISVYVVAGNNDSYQADYVLSPYGAFFKETAMTWGSLIKNTVNRVSMEKQFSIAGYYAIDLDNQTRLIVMNSNLFSRQAKGKNIASAANDELKWLHRELAAVKANNQKAFVAMHIPEAIDIYLSPYTRLFTLSTLWKTTYIQRFRAEVGKFSGNIAGIFSSHLHTHWIHIIAFHHHDIPMIGTASISPIFGNDPTLKIFTYSSQLGQLTNFITYDYVLKAQPVWQKKYDYAQSYLNNCSHCAIIQKK